MPPKKRTSTPSEIAELEITLLESDPAIWRRFAVRSDISLAKLHDVIQIVMGWTDSHMHQFTDADQNRYGRPVPDLDMEVRNESRVKLRDVAKKKGDRFLYEYDFGDGWMHGLKFVRASLSEPRKRYPVCLDGAMACPPDDCGGIPGYYNLLEAIDDPEHEAHEEMVEWLEWLGRDLDPDRFDLKEVNRDLKAVR